MSDREERLNRFTWLADAPLFIDEDLVNRFFDAVVQPEFDTLMIVRDKTEEDEQGIKGALGIGVEASVKPLPAFLHFLSPVGAKAKADAKLEGEQKKSFREGEQTQLRPISTPQRQLQELAVHYLRRYRDRVILDDGPLEGDDGSPWYKTPFATIQAVPRALAFFDLPPETKLIPTAAEFENGKIVQLYDHLRQKLTGSDGGPEAEYPDSDKYQPPQLIEKRQAYWKSYDKYFSATKAMITIEEAGSENGRIRWIDFRLPLAQSNSGDTLHLHISAACSYDTGVLAYNFVKRSHKHGIRLVGTLKSEPDMNVMAIYEK